MASKGLRLRLILSFGSAGRRIREAHDRHPQNNSTSSHPRLHLLYLLGGTTLLSTVEPQKVRSHRRTLGRSSPRSLSWYPCVDQPLKQRSHQEWPQRCHTILVQHLVGLVRSSLRRPLWRHIPCPSTRECAWMIFDTITQWLRFLYRETRWSGANGGNWGRSCGALLP